MKFHTIQNPPLSHGETFKEPTLTRASDYVSIEQIFAKYGLDIQMNPVQYRPIAQLSPDELDVLRNSTPVDELEDEDIVVQKQFVESTFASLNSKGKEKEEVIAEPTQPKDEPENEPIDENVSK